MRHTPKNSALSLFALHPAPHPRNIFRAQQLLSLDGRIKQLEIKLAYKWNYGQCLLLVNFLSDGLVDRHYELRNDARLNISLYFDQHMHIANYVLKRGFKIGNKSPDDLHSSSSLISFKKCVFTVSLRILVV